MTKKSITLLVLFLFVAGIVIAFSIQLFGHNRTFSENSSLTIDEIDQIPGGFSLSEDEDFAVLDAMDDRLLVTVYTEYPADSAYYNEVGYSSYSSRVFIYDLASESVADELELSPNELCTDGSLTEAGMLCTLLEMSEADSYRAKVICQATHSEPKTVYSCKVPNVPYYLPKSISLHDGSFAFTYVDPKKEEFGVQVTASDGAPAPVYTSSKIEDFIGTEISGNGEQFLYYMVMDDTPTLITGTKEAVSSTIPLDSSQSMHSFCLADDYIFLSLQTKHGQGVKDEVLLLDLSGETLLRQERGPYFNAAYDQGTGIFATDMKYNAYSMIPSESSGALSLSWKKIQLPNDTIFFFPASARTCIVTYGDFQPQVARISAS